MMIASYQRLWSLIPCGMEQEGAEQIADLPEQSVPDGVNGVVDLHDYAGYLHSLKVCS